MAAAPRGTGARRPLDGLALALTLLTVAPLPRVGARAPTGRRRTHAGTSAADRQAAQTGTWTADGQAAQTGTWTADGQAAQAGTWTADGQAGAGADDAQLGRAAGWFPLVGALVGALAGGVRLLAQPLLGTLPASALALAALIAATGALHQDGLADTADGLGARGAPERRLAAMRDSSTGAFGVLALVWWALLMLSALASLGSRQALVALVAAGGLSRWSALLHATGARRPARADGLGASFAVSGWGLALASATALGGAFLLCGPMPAIAALLAAAAGAALTAVFARRTLGGHTGDTLGAAVALSELTVLLVLLATARG